MTDVHSIGMVKLHDGREVDSMGREWQIECLARYVLDKPIEERRAFLASFEKRNQRAGDQLRVVMTAIHRSTKAA